MLLCPHDDPFAATDSLVRGRYINAIPAVQDANWTAVFGHVPRNDNITVSASFLRHEPILSMFVMPFPLVCSVVAVVSCSRNDHIMVGWCAYGAALFKHTCHSDTFVFFYRT